MRIFQNAALVHADGIPVPGSSIKNIDRDFFDSFFEKEFEESIEIQTNSHSQLLENTSLAKDGKLNTCGALLFARRPQFLLPVFIVKAVAFPGIAIEDESYIDSRDIDGKLSDVSQKSVGFVLTNIRHVQNRQGFNSPDQPEVPKIVLIELIANALIIEIILFQPLSSCWFFPIVSK